MNMNIFRDNNLDKILLLIDDYYISQKIYSNNHKNIERIKDYRNKNIAFYGFFSNRDLNVLNLLTSNNNKCFVFVRPKIVNHKIFSNIINLDNIYFLIHPDLNMNYYNKFKNKEIVNHKVLESIKMKSLNNKNNEIIVNSCYNIVAVIPVHGREPLLKYTIRRLYVKNKIKKVVCVGLSESEKNVALSEGADWLSYSNAYLGEKWNYGFKYAERYDPDAILFVGSGDWVDSVWIPLALPFLKDYGIVGKNNFYMTDIKNGEMRHCYWDGYLSNTSRFNETIGIGRLISKDFLKSVNYMPFKDKMNNSMDYFMYCNAINNGFKVKKILDKDGYFLSVSCDLWINKHIFDEHYKKAVLNKKKKKIQLTHCYDNTFMLKSEELDYINKEFDELRSFYADYKKIKNIS